MERLRALVGNRNQVDAELLMTLAEVDTRRLYLEEATDSMFRYCVERLGLSEGAAAKRLRVARLSLRFPRVLEFLREGRVHLSGLGILAAHMTEGNCVSLLEAASGKSKRDIERLVAGLFPKPEVATTVRRQSSPGPACGFLDLVSTPAPACEARPARKAVARRPEPLGAETFKVAFTASAALVGLLEEVQALTSHRNGSHDRTPELIEEALREMRDRLRKERFDVGRKARASAPKKSVVTRHIPATVRRAVWERDQGSCTYRDREGRRCESQTRLQYDHVLDWGLGGQHTAENLRLLCRPHNLAKARHVWPGQVPQAAP
jgi:hypothetical protein